jgi:hypothetical protein
MSGGEPTTAAIEVVRGDLGEERAAEVLDFWSRSGAFPGESARERLQSVVCVAVDDTGEVVGVNSVEDRRVPMVGRRFWVYRRLLTEYSDELATAMFNAAFEALAEEFEGGDAGPIGLCLVVGDREAMARHPEAIWPQTELVFAGYTPDNRQLRLRYFWGATVGPGAFNASNIEQLSSRDYPIDDRFEIMPLAEADSVTADDVLALWSSEGVVADEVARRRIDQVQLVAVAEGSQVVGVSSAFLEQKPRLRTDLWNYRTFVASGYRHSSLAAQLLLGNLELLERRFVSGEDTRAQGILMELENEDLMRGLNIAVWPASGCTFVGENTRGSDIRVRWFEGARVPPP